MVFLLYFVFLSYLILSSNVWFLVSCREVLRNFYFIDDYGNLKNRSCNDKFVKKSITEQYNGISGRMYVRVRMRQETFFTGSFEKCPRVSHPTNTTAGLTPKEIKKLPQYVFFAVLLRGIINIFCFM